MSTETLSDHPLPPAIAGTLDLPGEFDPLKVELTDGQLIHPILADVRPLPGFNPRTYFDPVELEDLAESVKAEGVIQPIILRRDPDDPSRFVIIAGERRWRAARMAGLERIPAIYREVSDRRAMAIAGCENDNRVDVSPAEEAGLARRMLDGCDGDRETAAKELKWSRTKFDARLALNHGTDAVLDALASRKIRVGHAELLVTLPAETQDGTLSTVIQDGISVADLKTKMKSFTQMLDAAIFDKSDCATCPHNSSLQGDFFTTTVGDARCANRACFGEKTTEELRRRRQALEGDYNCVHLDLERSPDTWAPLCKSGSNGVGATQYAACQGCEHFGALISSEPGKEGTVESELCFHLPCNTKRVAEYRRHVDADTGSESKPDANGAGNRTNTTTGRGRKPTRKGAAVAGRTKKVEAAVDAFLQRTASTTIKAHPKLVKALTLYALLRDAAWPKVQPEGLAALALDSRERASLLRQFHQLNEDALDTYIVEAAAVLVGTAPVASAVAVLQESKTELAGVFALDKAFLQTHTKAGIHSMMQEPLESGEPSFAARFDRKFGKNAFTKLIKQKTDTIITRILEAGIDLSRFVPGCVAERLTTEKK